MREIEFALRSVPNRCAAGLVGSKDMISYIDAELDDGATGVAGYGRPETCIEGIQKAHDASNLGTVPHMTS